MNLVVGRALCLVGLHSWDITNQYYPFYNAPKVQRWEQHCVCRFCQKKETYIWNYNPVVENTMGSSTVLDVSDWNAVPVHVLPYKEAQVLIQRDTFVPVYHYAIPNNIRAYPREIGYDKVLRERIILAIEEVIP